jgi:mannosyltransferase
VFCDAAQATILPAVTESRGRRWPEPWWVLVGAAGVVGAFVLFRFWTRSDLWLDEAQTVTIARLPLAQISAALRHDGAPPLYYFLLHFWMEVWGSGDLAVRSLSGVFGVACLPLALIAGRDLGGRAAAWASLVLVSTNAFAVRYSTEARMYMLLILLSLAGYLALRRALARPSPSRLVVVGLASGLLLLTHYWALYLMAAVVVGLALSAWRAGPGEARRAAVRVLGATGGGLVLFAPWVPSFLFQLAHTGTPWAGRADYTDLGVILSGFAGQGSREGDILGIVYVALLVLGLFGAAGTGWQVNLDLRVRPAARPLAWVALASLVLGLGASEIAGSTFSVRYAAVVFTPVMALVAMGVGLIDQPWLRRGTLGLVVVLGVLES